MSQIEEQREKAFYYRPAHSKATSISEFVKWAGIVVTLAIHLLMIGRFTGSVSTKLEMLTADVQLIKSHLLSSPNAPAAASPGGTFSASQQHEVKAQ